MNENHQRRWIIGFRQPEIELVVWMRSVTQISAIRRDLRTGRPLSFLSPWGRFRNGILRPWLAAKFRAVSTGLFQRQLAVAIGVGSRVALQELLQRLVTRLLGEGCEAKSQPAKKSNRRPG